MVRKCEIRLWNMLKPGNFDMPIWITDLIPNRIVFKIITDLIPVSRFYEICVITKVTSLKASTYFSPGCYSLNTAILLDDSFPSLVSDWSSTCASKLWNTAILLDDRCPSLESDWSSLCAICLLIICLCAICLLIICSFCLSTGWWGRFVSRLERREQHAVYYVIREKQ